MKKINVKGPIISNSDKEVYDWFGIEATCPQDITNILDDTNEDIEIEINSNGGLVTMGSEIYTALRAYTGNVTAKIVGMAASAASVIAMGADTVEISPTAQIMIHKAWLSGISGNSDELQNASQALDASDEGICNAYHAKTGLDKAEIINLMKNDTFMSAEKAVELGFADKIMFSENAPELVASLGTGMLPKEVINKYLEDKQIRNESQKMLREIEKQELLDSL